MPFMGWHKQNWQGMLKNKTEAPTRFELVTSSLLDWRSNQLSYGAVDTIRRKTNVFKHFLFVLRPANLLHGRQLDNCSSTVAKISPCTLNQGYAVFPYYRRTSFEYINWFIDWWHVYYHGVVTNWSRKFGPKISIFFRQKNNLQWYLRQTSPEIFLSVTKTSKKGSYEIRTRDLWFTRPAL